MQNRQFSGDKRKAKLHENRTETEKRNRWKKETRPIQNLKRKRRRGGWQTQLALLVSKVFDTQNVDKSPISRQERTNPPVTIKVAGKEVVVLSLFGQE